MKMKKTELKVKGMHCHSCEMLVKDELEEIPGVHGVEANHKDGFVKIVHDESVNIEAIKSKIKELGYEVIGIEKKE